MRCCDPAVKLVGLALSGSLALTFLMLGCALRQYQNYWPLFVIIFYVLAPLPSLISRRVSGDVSSTSTACKELSLFFTAGIVVSAFALPIVLANAGPIQWGACAFVLAADVIAFMTILGFFFFFRDDDDYYQW